MPFARLVPVFGPQKWHFGWLLFAIFAKFKFWALFGYFYKRQKKAYEDELK